MAGNVSGNRVTKIEYEKRVRAVQEWILQGRATCDIINKITTKWNINERQAYKYHNASFEIFKKANEQDISIKKAYHIELRKRLFLKLKNKDEPAGTRVALRVVDSMARIEGLFVNKKDDVPYDEKTNDEKPLTPKEIRELNDKLNSAYL